MRFTLLILVPLWLAASPHGRAEPVVPVGEGSLSFAIVTRRYRCPDNYPGILYQKAFEKTGDAAFQRPAGESTTWDPKPSIALTKLGLKMRAEFSMAFIYSTSEFVYSADVKGHEEFLRLNQSLNLRVRRLP